MRSEILLSISETQAAALDDEVVVRAFSLKLDEQVARLRLLGLSIIQPSHLQAWIHVEERFHFIKINDSTATKINVWASVTRLTFPQ